MEELFEIESLYIALKNIFDNKQDVKEATEKLEELHFYILNIKSFAKKRENLQLDKISKISYYLLVFLTNPINQEYEEYVKQFKKFGLKVCASCFEFLYEYLINTNQVLDSNSQEEVIDYIFFSSVAYSLCDMQANSMVLAKKGLEYIKDKIDSDKKVLMVYFYLLFKRSFKEIIKNNIKPINLEEISICNAIKEFAYLMINGKISENYKIKFLKLRKELYGRNHEMFFYITFIHDVLNRVIDNSIWNILSDEGVEKYLNILTKIDTKNVYELWEAQKYAVNCTKSGYNYLSDNINKVIISMPTSAGKTLLAEILIAKRLLQLQDKIVVYVVPSLALSHEVEVNFFRRFRKLGYRVSTEFDLENILSGNTDLEKSNIIILTPEKLDLLIKKDTGLLSKISLVVFDEFHKVMDGQRGCLLETLIAYFSYVQEFYNIKILLMSAILGDINVERFGKNTEKIIFIKNDWTPTRKLFGVFEQNYKQKSDSAKIVRLANLGKLIKGSVYKSGMDLKLNYINSNKAINDVIDINYITKPRAIGISDKSDNKYDVCWKAINSIIDRPILIYFYTKRDIYNFINKSEKYLKEVDEPYLNSIRNVIKNKLGAEHLLYKALKRGIAFHNGDIPEDIRNLIEEAFKKNKISVLATTSTLADGINLPVSTLIIGTITQQHNPNEEPHFISMIDYKNIIGRIGRAVIDTEGKIFIVRHKEYWNYDDKIQEFTNPNTINIEFETAIEKYINDINFIDIFKYVVEEKMETETDNITRQLQIAIFYAIDFIEASTYDEFLYEFSKKLFLKDDDLTMSNLNSVVRPIYEFAIEIEEHTRKLYNSTGLSYKTNKTMQKISDKIESNMDILSNHYETIFTEEIFKEILECNEFGIPDELSEIEHYDMWLNWINGNSYIEIRDLYFNNQTNIQKKTYLCTKYIREIYRYKLTWALSSLATLCQNDILRDVIRKYAQYTKYGTNNENAIKLLISGVSSRELAIEVAKTYEEKLVSLGIIDWLISLKFDDLKDMLESNFDYTTKSQIKDLIIRNVKKTNKFTIDNILRTNVVGLKYHEYKSLIENGEIKLHMKLSLQQDKNNEYDEFAVKVTYDGAQIGYIPKEYSEEVYDLLEGGEPLETIVVNYSNNFVEISIEAIK